MPSSVAVAPIATETTTTLQNAVSGTGNGATLTLTPYDDLVELTIADSAGTATVVIEESKDAGGTWLSSFAAELVASALTLVTSIALTGNTRRFLYQRPPGVNALRCRISAVVGGNVTATAIVRRRA